MLNDKSSTILQLLRIINTPRRPINLIKFKHDMTLWLSLSRQVFMVIEDPKFRDMIATLSADTAELLPKSHNTIHEWVLKEFDKQ